jgi:site-specific DNA-adenine methylase
MNTYRETIIKKVFIEKPSPALINFFKKCQQDKDEAQERLRKIADIYRKK